jgi:uncharacterized membrane protein
VKPVGGDKKVKAYPFLILIAVTAACVHHTAEEIIPVCSPDLPVSWETSVAPVIHTKCAIAGCHNGSNPYIGELNTFSEVQGNAADIQYQLTNHAMPPANLPQLTSFEKAKIECWISQGAKNP